MSQISLIKKFQFSSSHRMFNGDFSKEENDQNFGKCQNIHGHNYFLEVHISGSVDHGKGYFVNLSEFSYDVYRLIIDVIDHQYINDVLPNCKNKPVTMEVIATWIWESLTSNLTRYDFVKIRLWETSDNSVEIYK